VSLLLGAWFYGSLAAASRGARGGPLAVGLGWRPRAVLDVLGLVGLVSGIALLLGLPIVLLIGLTALVSPPVAVLGSLLVAVGGFSLPYTCSLPSMRFSSRRPARWRRSNAA